MERRIFAGFSDEEVELFRSMLGRVRAEVEDFEDDELDEATFGIG